MTDFLKIAKSIVVHFAHICTYGVETVKQFGDIQTPTPILVQLLAQRYWRYFLMHVGVIC